MLLVFGDEHKEHLAILNTLSTDGTFAAMDCSYQFRPKYPRVLTPRLKRVTGTFVPWNFGSLELSVHGTFRPLELLLPIAKMT